MTGNRAPNETCDPVLDWITGPDPSPTRAPLAIQELLVTGAGRVVRPRSSLSARQALARRTNPERAGASMTGLNRDIRSPLWSSGFKLVAIAVAVFSAAC